MLDLRELERKLDAALEKETKETLTNWLLGKRLNQLFSTGQGTFSEFDTQESLAISYKAYQFDIECIVIDNSFEKDAA